MLGQYGVPQQQAKTGERTGPDPQLVWKSQWTNGANGDGNLFYPGTPEIIGGKTHIPVESMRLKFVRDGVEDYEILRQAEAELGRARTLELIRPAFRNRGDWTQNAETLLATRVAVGRALAAAQLLRTKIDDSAATPSSQAIQPATPIRTGYKVLWNAAFPETCRAYNKSVTLDTSKFRITANKKEKANGNVVFTISQGEGLYPYFDPVSGKSVNGGLPQNVNISKHLAVWSAHVTKLLGPPASPSIHGEANGGRHGYSGVVGIDWELWVPVYEQNVDTILNNGSRYQLESLRLVQDAHPQLPPDEAAARAKKAFETAAAAMMLATIKKGQELWPLASWGFYDYPSCYGSISGDVGQQSLRAAPWQHVDTRKCNPQVTAANDQMGWLWSAVDALMPSPYIVSTNTSFNKAWLTNVLGESLRIQNVSKGRGGSSGRLRRLSIYSYAWAQVHHSLRKVPARPDCCLQANLDYCVPCFIDRTAARQMLCLPKELGADSVILWGAGADVANASRCEALGHFIETVLGPTIRQCVALTAEPDTKA